MSREPLRATEARPVRFGLALHRATDPRAGGRARAALPLRDDSRGERRHRRGEVDPLSARADRQGGLPAGATGAGAVAHGGSGSIHRRLALSSDIWSTPSTEPTIADEARLLLGRDLHSDRARVNEPNPICEPPRDRYPALRLALARMARERGDRAAAEAELDSAISVFSARVDANIDDIEARAALGQSGLGSFRLSPDAAEIIEKGLARVRRPSISRGPGTDLCLVGPQSGGRGFVDSR